MMTDADPVANGTGPLSLLHTANDPAVNVTGFELMKALGELVTKGHRRLPIKIPPRPPADTAPAAATDANPTVAIAAAIIATPAAALARMLSIMPVPALLRAIASPTQAAGRGIMPVRREETSPIVSRANTCWKMVSLLVKSSSSRWR